jgi:hypothetical protein
MLNVVVTEVKPNCAELLDTLRLNVSIDWTRRGKCAGKTPGTRPTRSSEVRLSAGQAGEGDPER